MANFMPNWTTSYVRLIKLKPSCVRLSDFKSYIVYWLRKKRCYRAWL